MPATSNPTLLALLAIRLLGMADDEQDGSPGRVRRVTGLDPDRGRQTEYERQLADEVKATDASDLLQSTYRDFVVQNDRLLRASTDWQIRPNAEDSLAVNNHVDRRWDTRVLHTLADVDAYLRGACRSLSARLQRFRGYDQRFPSALARVERGEHAWVNRPRADSCHTVWMELHELLGHPQPSARRRIATVLPTACRRPHELSDLAGGGGLFAGHQLPTAGHQAT